MHNFLRNNNFPLGLIGGNNELETALALRSNNIPLDNLNIIPNHAINFQKLEERESKIEESDNPNFKNELFDQPKFDPELQQDQEKTPMLQDDPDTTSLTNTGTSSLTWISIIIGVIIVIIVIILFIYFIRRKQNKGKRNTEQLEYANLNFHSNDIDNKKTDLEY